MLDMQKSCLDPNAYNSYSNDHSTRTNYGLINSPEVFMVNLQWNGEP